MTTDEQTLKLAAMVSAIYSQQTCGEACWYAREETCRCKCAGVNHGCLKDGSGERPLRTRRVGQTWYTLDTIATGWRDAQDCRQAKYLESGERMPVSESIKPSFGPPPLYAICGATQAQVKNWPELAAWQGWESQGDCMAVSERHRPFLLWRKGI